MVGSRCVGSEVIGITEFHSHITEHSWASLFYFSRIRLLEDLHGMSFDITAREDVSS